MPFDRLNKRLEGISDASKKGYPIRNLYRLMYNKEIWYEAYARIYSNKGAITKGVNENTLDGFSSERVEKIISKLKENKYKFTSARRTYISKRSSNKKRPLGIPTGDDKLVQEVARILLERIYEPIFSDDSHGFRSQRSCHTALKQIHKQWTGIKWFAEFDIKGFFDNMDHSLLVELLEQKIDDKRFIKLIKCMLKAGYLEDFQYHPTYSGTPQGGVISPILSNIYLHELDTFVMKLQNSFTQGKRRKANPQHKRITNQMTQIREKIDRVGKNPRLIAELKALDKVQKNLPSMDLPDPNYKRLRYCRYADDFVLGIIGTKDEAEKIMSAVKTFIEEDLRLSISEEKTTISTGKKGVEFLGYRISVYRDEKTIRTRIKGRYTRRRTIADTIRLQVPKDRPQRFCQKYGYGDWDKMKPTHRPSLSQASDVEIIQTYNVELRGFANYYLLAKDVKAKLNRLEYMSNYSLFKTLAFKRKTRMTKIMAKLKQKNESNEYVYCYEAKGKKCFVPVFKLKHMINKPINQTNVDKVPTFHRIISPKSELVKRLNRTECEYCKRTDLPLESHHVRKLKDLKQKPKREKWQQVMIARNRKTLVICTECHHLLHAGKLPDLRYKEKS